MTVSLPELVRFNRPDAVADGSAEDELRVELSVADAVEVTLADAVEVALAALAVAEAVEMAADDKLSVADAVELSAV